MLLFFIWSLLPQVNQFLTLLSP